MSYIKLTSNKISESLKCPTSKSYANRALILAALKKDKVQIKDLPNVSDVSDLLFMFEQLGLNLKKEHNSITILNHFPDCELKSKTKIKLLGGEGGTTIRFLVALLCLGENTYQIKLKGRLAKRPWEEYFEALRALGASIHLEGDLLEVKGPLNLRGNHIEINCSRSTQFASSLLMLQTFESFELELKNVKASSAYIDMTKKLCDLFREESVYVVPPDFSSLGYLISYAVLKQDLEIINVFAIDKYQADSKIFDVLEQIKANYSFTQKGLRIFKSDNLAPFVIDASECIDLGPTLMLLASFIKGTSTLKNVSLLRHKESDRLEEMQRMLDYFSCEYFYDQELDVFKIKGSQDNKNLKPIKYKAAEDHRMVMVASLFTKLYGGGEVAPFHCTSKSFIEFFDIFQ